ncbi:MAG TPA: hypothetical protein VFH67_01845 [bacterium]|nr:hypothetical protein [bacterium]
MRRRQPALPRLAAIAALGGSIVTMHSAEIAPEQAETDQHRQLSVTLIVRGGPLPPDLILAVTEWTRRGLRAVGLTDIPLQVKQVSHESE